MPAPKTEPRPQLDLVAGRDVAGQSAPRGTALIVAPLPPLPGATASHAAEMLWLLNRAGHRAVPVSAFGTSPARHQINFASRQKFADTRLALGREGQVALSIVYGRLLDFQRIAKPFWYRRRLEEIRRLLFLWQIVRSTRKTVLVLDKVGIGWRSWISMVLILWLAALLFRHRVSIVQRGVPAHHLAERLTGIKLSRPDAHEAEDAVFAEAMSGSGEVPLVRLTTLRLEQSLAHWARQRSTPDVEALRRDIDTIVTLARRHDMRNTPAFRLLMQAPYASAMAELPAPTAGRAYQAAIETDPRAARLGLPLPRYALHLRAACRLSEQFPLTSRAEARKTLAWYLQEAGSDTPQGWVPVPEEMRHFFVTTAKGACAWRLPEPDAAFAHVAGRDARPFALSPVLASLYAQDDSAGERFDIADSVDRIAFVVDVLCALPGGVDARKVIGRDAVRWLSAPLGNDPANASRLELIIALQARHALSCPPTSKPLWDRAGLADWVRFAGERALPGILPLVERRPLYPRATARRMIVTGLPRSGTGVGANVHMSLAALSSIGLTTELRDMGDRLSPIPQETKTIRRRPRRTAVLHHLNADRIPQAILSPSLLAEREAFHIGYLLWEFQALPEAHRLALDMLDEIWVPSRFVRQVYGRATSVPVRNMLKGLKIPDVAPLDRARLGATSRDTVFISCFDLRSSVARKNPLATVTAFRRAFPRGNEPVRLIIKTTHVPEAHWGDPEGQMRSIHNLAAADPRIKVMEERLSFPDLMALIASADCLVSSHRAEGFGLMPAYALGLGRAVIATDYSGTTDFCTEATSFPVSARMVPTAPGQTIFPTDDAEWAEIDPQALSDTMREVAGDRGSAQMRAEAGRDLIQTRYAPARQAQRYRRRLEEIGII